MFLRRVAFVAWVTALLLACSNMPGPDGGIDVPGSDSLPLDAPGTDDAPGDGAVELPSVAPRITLATSTDITTPAAPPMLTWHVLGDGSAAALMLQAIEPGPPAAANGARSDSPGVAPGTGATHWLASDGTWRDARTAYAMMAASGAATITLPREREGEWRFVARLETGDGTVASLASVRVLVSSAPAMQLRMNRLAASPDDFIAADLAIAPGAMPASGAVVAWLTRPDGSVAPLPEGSRLGGALMQGPLRAARIPLVARTFHLQPNGTYRVSARLFDAGGNTVAVAEANFTVCDGQSSVTGTMRRADGTPLVSAAPGSLVARVAAVDVATGESTVGALAADGTYSLLLTAGSYVLIANRVDDTGDYSARTGPITVGGSCEASPSIDLRSGPPGPVNAALVDAAIAMLPPDSLHDQLAADGLPRPRVFVVDSRINGLPATPEERTATSALESLAFGPSNTDIDATDASRVMNTLSLWAESMSTGGSMEVDVDRILAQEFILSVVYADQFSARQVHLRLVRVSDGQVIAATYAPYTSDAQLPSVISGLTQRLLTSPMGDGRSLLRTLRDAEPCPVAPVITLAPVADIMGGSPAAVHVSATVRDSNGRTCPPLPVRLRNGPAIYGPFSDQVVMTDATGLASFTFVVDGTPGSFEYTALLDGPPAYRQQPRYYHVLARPSSLEANTDRAAIPVGESASVAVSLHNEDGTPIVGQSISLTTTRGALAAPTAMTDSAGEATVRISAPAGTPPGLATITARGTDAMGTTWTTDATLVILDPLNLAITPATTSVFDGSSVPIGGMLTGVSAPIAGAEITLTVMGGGTITPSAVTDASGMFSAVYRAPESGTGTASITASVTVEGQTATASTTIGFAPVMFSADDGWWIGHVDVAARCSTRGYSFDDVSIHISRSGLPGRTWSLRGSYAPSVSRMALATLPALMEMNATTPLASIAGPFATTFYEGTSPWSIAVTQDMNGVLNATETRTTTCVKGGPTSPYVFTYRNMVRVR